MWLSVALSGDMLMRTEELCEEGSLGRVPGQVPLSVFSLQKPCVSPITRHCCLVYNSAHPATSPSQLAGPFPNTRAERMFLKAQPSGFAESQFSRSLGDGRGRGEVGGGEEGDAPPRRQLQG